MIRRYRKGQVFRQDPPEQHAVDYEQPMTYGQFQHELSRLIEQTKALRAHVDPTSEMWEAVAFLALDRAIIELDRVHVIM